MQRDFKPLNESADDHMTQVCKDYQSMKMTTNAFRTDVNANIEKGKRTKEAKKDRSVTLNYVQELYREGRDNDYSDSD